MEIRQGVPRIPAISRVLIGVAVVQLAVLVAMDWYRFFGPFLIVRPDDVVEAFAAVAPFLLAAAVLAAASRWAAARPFLVVGGTLLALHAVVGGALAAWWTWWELNPGDATALTTPAAVGAVLVRDAAMAAGFLCLVAGIARSQPAAAHGSPARRRATGALALLVAIAAIAVTLVLLAVELPVVVDATVGVLTVVDRILTASAAVGLAALSWVALRRPWPWHRAAMAWIGFGAAMASVGLTATWLLQWYVVAADDVELLWAFWAVSLAVPTALLAVAAGFAGLAATTRRDSTVGRQLGDAG